MLLTILNNNYKIKSKYIKCQISCTKSLHFNEFLNADFIISVSRNKLILTAYHIFEGMRIMDKYSGKSVFGGIAIGKIRIFQKGRQEIKNIKADNPKSEIERFNDARNKAIEGLQELYEKALKEAGEQSAAILQIHQLMLNDIDYTSSVEGIITKQNVTAEFAVAVTRDYFYEMFSSMEDEYMKARAADVKDVSERVIRILCNDHSKPADSKVPSIIIADDLAPSETVQLDKDLVLAFVTVHGSVNSHTAILAKTMGIPAITNVDIPLNRSINGRMAVVDGYNGIIYVDPDSKFVREMQTLQEKELYKRKLLLELKGKDNVTLDGKKMMLYANIGNTKDLASVTENDANGIGLFRSEFIYFEKNSLPTEEEQFEIYKTAAETLAGKRVVVRTLDIGADKQADYFNLETEENPAMGLRAIRICLTNQEIFKTQLRALYRASAFGNISIMYPFITSVEEIKEIKKITEEVKKELDAQGVDYSHNIEEGIMIETPAAALISDKLAKEVDFFSIGTNDLSQYAMAIDRQNSKTDRFYDPHHLAVLRMIKMVVDNAHKNGIKAGICGELGADLSLTETFLKIGVDALSVSPAMILPLRDKIRKTDTSKLDLQYDL